MGIDWQRVGQFLVKLIRLVRPQPQDTIAVTLVVTGIAILSGPLWQAVVLAFLEEKVGLVVAVPSARTGWVLVGLGLTFFLTVRYVDRPSPGQTIGQRTLKDREALKRLLDCINIPFFEHFIEIGHYHRFPMDTLYFYEKFHALANSEVGHVHDRKIRRRIEKLDRTWTAAVGFSRWFTDTPNPYIFRFKAPHEAGMPGYFEARDNYIRRLNEAQEAFSLFLDCVRKRHPEIDINAHSEHAWQSFLAERN